jgi:hypothetical protein
MEDYVVIDIAPKTIQFKKDSELDKEYTNCSLCNRVFLRGNIYTISYYRCKKCRWYWNDICNLFC